MRLRPPRYNRFVLKCVDRILLRVPNVAAASKFYAEALGLRIDRKQSTAVAMKFEDGDTELILHDDRNRSDVEIVFGVDDVASMYARRSELNLTFLVPPSETAQGRRATVRDPFGNVLVLVDHKTPGQDIAGGAAAGALFEEAAPQAPASDAAALIAAYVELGRTADDLPYTRHFEALLSQYARTLPGEKPAAAEVWRQLLTLRKAGKLPKLGAAASKPPAIEPEAKDRLRTLLGADIGRRDRLPYTPRFDEIVVAFNKQFARPYPPHVVWRLVATLAK